MSESPLPVLAITMGDAAGVGPEVIAGVWTDERIHRICRPVVLGQPEILRRACDLRKVQVPIVEIDSVRELPADTTALPCLAASNDPLLDLRPGISDARTGEVAFQAVLKAAELALAGEIQGMVTAPLGKAALHAAGHHYPGHTELLAELCGTPRFGMMLYLPPGVANHSPAGLGVAHVTLHTSMRQALDLITVDAILEKCELATSMMRRLGVAKPRIGVAALNPHAGEEGLFGDEEITTIAPAVAAAQAAGINASGPLSADTLMIAARDGKFDAVVAQYHDQGHIALKLLAMHSAVNVTLGLPIVRTSVAHGTALDLAWQGAAETTGMISAIETAAKLAASP